MEKEKKSVWLHKENIDEWRFIGIWADMLDFDLSQHLNGYSPKSCLILFKHYDNPLQMIQNNLRLRNLYNQYIALYNQLNLKDMKEKASQMDLEIEKNIKCLLESKIFCIYCTEINNLLSK